MIRTPVEIDENRHLCYKEGAKIDDFGIFCIEGRGNAPFKWVGFSVTDLEEGKGSAISNQNYRINDRIRVREVRLIDENNQNMGVMQIKDARDYALSKNLDLVEVAPDARPPVCRVMDYGKFMYEQDKKARTARKSQKEIEIKGLRIRPDTDEYHIGFKVRQARGFLQKGNKVRITCQFRGRERSHPEIARRTMTEIAAQLTDIAVVEQQANFEGRNMTMVLAPSAAAAEKPKAAPRPARPPNPAPAEGQAPPEQRPVASEGQPAPVPPAAPAGDAPQV